MENEHKRKAEECRKAEVPQKATRPSKRETERVLSQKVYELFAFPAMASMPDGNYQPKGSSAQEGVMA